MFEWLKSLLGMDNPAPPAQPAPIAPAIDDNPPIIGISGGNSDSSSVRAMMTQIRAADAIPLLLSNHAQRDPALDLAKIDALVIMGNDGDIDPVRYGEAAHPKTLIEQDKAREAYEFSILTQAMRQKMPVLGVCGGMQRINVIQGGSLHQHVPDLLGNDSHAQQDMGIPPFCPVQVVHLEPASQLAQIAGISSLYTPDNATATNAVLAENSMHHQAVNRVGHGLRASARADDGVIEAIEPDPAGPLAGQFLLGVQWHPEFGASPLGPRLAAALAKAGKEYACSTARSHPMHEAVEETLKSSAPAIQKKLQERLHTQVALSA